MIRVNLLPRVTRQVGGRDWQSMAGGLVAVLVLLGLAYLWWAVASESRAIERRMTEMQAEIKRLEAVARKVDQYKADKKQLEERLKVIRTLSIAQKVPV
ncbi:MAG: hypothetical protein ACE5MG_13290, partial [Candidatus Methylomirabilales bacterium]